MAKRSPILGYNHNVKYRGLIFHVQTEDSGLATPHLFTHLFYGGVIISTRKLVYDAGSAEDAIKGLMQAQHKVVLKDLKGGKFDDKIDVYLAGTEGLEPRYASNPAAAAASSDPEAGPPRQSEVDMVVRPSDPEIRVGRPDTESDMEISISRTLTPMPTGAEARPRTITADRGARRLDPPPPPPNMAELDPPTDPDAGEAMVAALANATLRTSMPEFDSSLGSELLARTRSKHDTEVQSDGVPGAIGAMQSGRNTPGDSIPPLPPPPNDKRGSALAAGALPPARPVNRPPTKQAIQPPAVVSRPISDHRLVDDRSDAIEVYAPPPPSVDAPPGVGSERPGQYAQHKKVSQRLDVLKQSPQDRSAPIPAGLARPGRSTSAPPLGGPPRPGTPTGELRVPDLASRPPERPRTPTPARLSPSSGPVVNRAPSTGSGGVVMTRPAVIVGAPAKPNVPPRVRKAREDEGRGFGQGLISEKSLDEVILAYLSEDADDK